MGHSAGDKQIIYLRCNWSGSGSALHHAVVIQANAGVGFFSSVLQPASRERVLVRDALGSDVLQIARETRSRSESGFALAVLLLLLLLLLLLFCFCLLFSSLLTPPLSSASSASCPSISISILSISPSDTPLSLLRRDYARAGIRTTGDCAYSPAKPPHPLRPISNLTSPPPILPPSCPTPPVSSALTSPFAIHSLH